MKDKTMSVGEKIKYKRIEQGLTLEELGQRVGLATQTMWKYENNKTKNIGKDTLAKIASVLHCDVLWLWGIIETDDNTTESIIEGIVNDHMFITQLQNLCNKWNNIGAKFDTEDYEDILEYIKFKAMQKG